MISSSDRRKAIELIAEARKNGARLFSACAILNISTRTYERWIKEGVKTADKRPTAVRKKPNNKLSQEERNTIINIINKAEFADITLLKSFLS